MTIMAFRYDDETSFEGDWHDAPGYGVQTIVYADSYDGPTLRHHGNYYRLDNGAVVAMDYDSLMRYIVDDLGLVKVGSMCSHAKYVRIMQAAKADRQRLGSG